VTAPASLCLEALDFAPQLLAIQERPPSRLPRALLLTVVALVLLLLAWACFAKLDIVATAEGRLVPLTFTKIVQPVEAGVVSEILVKEGDVVRQGDVLVRLDPRMAQADTRAYGTDAALRRLTIRMIDGELSGQAFIPAASERMDVYAQVASQFRARRQALQDSVAQESEVLNKARADLQAAQQVLSKLSQTVPVYRQSAEAYQRLMKEGFVGELAALEKSRDLVEKEQDFKSQAATVAGLAAAIAQSERRIQLLRSQYRSQLENDRMEASAQLNRSDQELEKSTVRAGQLEIRAPNAGIVKDLAVTTRGAVVAAGALLMNVVPVDEPLQAEVLLKNDDVGFVSPGQLARMKVATYPFQKYGLLDGKVALVSADASDARQANGAQPPPLTYRAIVRLEQTHLVSASTGEKLPLGPGMAIVAEIHQGSRTVMEYLLSPVQKVAQEAGRER
jgi:HlyD family secretion protein